MAAGDEVAKGVWVDGCVPGFGVVGCFDGVFVEEGEEFREDSFDRVVGADGLVFGPEVSLEVGCFAHVIDCEGDAGFGVVGPARGGFCRGSHG